MLQPKLFGILRDRKTDLSKEQVRNDLISGVIVAIIALPLSVALAIASGVTPDKGLITAIIAGFLISLLGGSRVQIGGPTGAFVVIIYGIIQKHGLSGLMIATIMAGILMIIMGLLKFGSVLRFIPYPTTTGFTSGIALVLLSTQIKDFFGLRIDNVPSEFVAKWISYIKNFPTINFAATFVGICALLIIIFWPKVNKTIPGSLIALIVMTAFVQLTGLNVETIGSRFGDISGKISMVNFSEFSLSFDSFQRLIGPAITIAFLAGIESLLSAVVSDGMIGKKHNSNMELIAQGIANIASALFGGIPATGAIARTAANVRNGGRTPIAGIVHAIVLLLIMLIFMPLAKMIPMTVLSAILVVVAYNMSEWRNFVTITKSTRSDATVLIVTFILTVVLDLVVAIGIGMIIAMFLFVRRMSENPLLRNITKDMGLDDEEEEVYVNEEEISSDIEVKKLLKKRIAVYELHGPFFYGVVNTFIDTLSEIGNKADIVILRMNHISTMDVSTLKALKQVDERCLKEGIKILYTEINSQPDSLMDRIKFKEKLGQDKFFKDLESAIKEAKFIESKIDFKDSSKKAI